VLEIILFRTMSGAGYALAMLACQDYVIDVLPKEARARSLGLFSAAMFGGIFAGSALGGIIADRLGQSPVFVVSAALILASAILIYRLMPPWEHAARLPETDVPPSSLAAFKALTNLRFSSLVFGVVIPQQVLDQVFVSYLLALQLDALGASVSDIARMLMVYFLMIILSGSLFGRLSSWNLGPAVIALSGTVLSGLALLAAAVWPTWLMMLLAVIGTGVGQGLVRGPQVALVMDIAETSLRHVGSNTVLGTLRGLERGGSIVGLIVIASLTTQIGYDGAMGVIALWVLAGAMGFVALNLAGGSLAAIRRRDAS
jgi:MFS family permease